MSLYLKYRPQTFDDITGQKHIVDILKKQVQLGKTMHNYLFFGPRGTGKTTTARILAKAVNCLNPKDGNPCNECANCQAINKGQTLDFVEIDAASHTQVDNIREEIIDKAPYPPTQLKKKVYIIDEVHMLSKAAFNALLKIMEEPPEYLMFILATTEINKVPDTIISRCQVFNFRKLSEPEIVSRLKYIAEKEGIPYTEKALYMIAYASEGALRDAVKYLEQVSVLGEVNEENVVKFLGIAPDSKIREFLDLLKKWQISGDKKVLEKIFNFLSELELGGVDLGVFAKQVLRYIDEHFLEDVEFYSNVAKLLKKIFLNLKTFPNKLLAFKVELGGFLIAEASSLPENKEQKVISGNQTKQKEQKSDEIKDSFEDQKNTSQAQPVYEEERQQKVDNNQLNTEQNQQTEQEIVEKEVKINPMEIMSQLISKCDKISIRTILKKYAAIDSFDGKNLNMIIINKIQHNLLIKEPNLKYLENLAKKVLGKEDIILHIQYMPKEEFLKKKLQES